MRYFNILLLLLTGISLTASAQQENYKLLFHAVGPTENSVLGMYIQSIGDWDHDGYGDIYACITMPELSGEYCRDYYGGEPMDTIPDLYFFEESSTLFGRAPSYSSSLNGDSYGDFTLEYNISTDTSRINVYFGAELPDSIPDIVLPNEVGFLSAFGCFCCTCGDINGDGYDDFGTSDVSYSLGNPGEKGKIYIYYGGPSFDSIPDFTITSLPNEFGDLFGNPLSLDGDVDNDGYNDIFCLSLDSDLSEGGAYLFKGGVQLDSIPDWHIPYGYMGNYLGTDGGGIVKDLNGDGYDDIAIGWGGGYCLIFFGGERINTTPDLQLYTGTLYANEIASAGDINNDGYGDIITTDFSLGIVRVYFGGDPMNASSDLLFYAASWEAGCAGDVNGDGVDDLMYFSQYVNGGSNGQIFIWGDTTLTSVNQPDVPANPASFQLHQNYPNPFNACTGISFYVGKAGKYELKIYNVQGRTVYSLRDEYHSGVSVHLTWDGRDLAGKVLSSGIYFLELSNGKDRQVKKMEILR